MNISDTIQITFAFPISTPQTSTFCERVDDCLGIDPADGRVNYFLNERGEWVLVSGAGGGVASVTGNLVDNTDPNNPVVDAAVSADSGNVLILGTDGLPYYAGGGGGVGCADNGLSIDGDTGCVILGGTLDRDTLIDGLDSHYLLLGDVFAGEPFFVIGNLTSIGGDSAFAVIGGVNEISLNADVEIAMGVTDGVESSEINIDINGVEISHIDIFGDRSGFVAEDDINNLPVAAMFATSANGVDDNFISVAQDSINAIFTSALGDVFGLRLDDTGFGLGYNGNQLFYIDDIGDVQIAAYPDTRDDGVPANILHTDAIGNVKASPIAKVAEAIEEEVKDMTSIFGRGYIEIFNPLTGLGSLAGSILSGTGTAGTDMNGWGIRRAGAGTEYTALAAEAGISGILQGSTGTVNNSNLALTTTNLWIDAQTVFKHRFRLPQVSTSLQRFVTRMGATAITSDGNSTIYFRYTDDVNGGRFQFITRTAAGLETVVDTGVTATAAQWYVIQFHFEQNGAELHWRINNTSGVVTTNIIIDFSRFLNCALQKTVGTTPVFIDFGCPYAKLSIA